jgi:hypothetical protein
MSAYRNRVQEVTWKLDEFSPNPCTMASESAVPMLQPEEASTGEEGALKRNALTDGLDACATESTAEDGCSVAADEAEAAKKAGLSDVPDQGGDATVVSDEEEEDDGMYCPFDQVDHVDGNLMEEEEDDDEDDDEEDRDDFPPNAFYAECKARHDATTVAGELTDEDDDDVYSPFDYAFLEELGARHEEEFQELLGEMMI